MIEYARALRYARAAWPGVRPLLDWALAAEAAAARGGAAGRLAVLAGDAASGERGGLALLRRTIAASVNAFDTAGRLTPVRCRRPPRRCRRSRSEAACARELSARLPLPGRERAPPSDCRDRGPEGTRRKAPGRSRDEPGRRPRTASSAHGKPTGERSPAAGSAGFVYDEWSQSDHDYLPDHCVVHEIAAEPVGSAQAASRRGGAGPEDAAHLRVAQAGPGGKEKRLESGDAIDVDLLVEFLVSRRHEPSPPVRFYQKPRIRKRDLATLILMDCSGSTGTRSGRRRRIIEIERESALILGQGLAGLGDSFAICGFSGQGRENCEYYVYKGFADRLGTRDDPQADGRGAAQLDPHRRRAAPLGDAARGRAAAARSSCCWSPTAGRWTRATTPRPATPSSTSAWPARRTGARASTPSPSRPRKRAGPTWRSCSPGRRFAILPSIDALPAVLPRLYMRLTY